MEITYDGTGSLQIKFDDGREMDLDEILNLDKCLTLTRTSREWNRKRVVELEDELERGGPKMETKLPSRNLYTDEEVAALQSSEAELVAGPLRRRIAELERTLAGAIDREAKLEEKVRGYDLDRHTERDRADRERQRADGMESVLEAANRDHALNLGRAVERAEQAERQRDNADQQHRQSIAAQDLRLAALTRNIELAQEIIHDSEVQEAMEVVVTRHAATLAKALQDVSNTLA